MNNRVLQTGLWVLLSCIGWQAQAGTVIQQEQRDPGSDQARFRVTLSVDAGKLRVEGENPGSGPGSGKFAMIFDQAKQVLWMMDPGKGSYLEMTAAQVQGMGQQMQQMMQQMEAQLAQIPPEQRAMVEQMMKQQMGNSAPPQVTVREKSRGEKVGQFVCTRYEVLTQGQVTEEICAAPAAQLQLEASALETFKALAAFYEPLSRQVPKGGWSVSSAMREIQGFPVRTVVYEGQKPASEWVVVKIETKPLDVGLFTLPANLKKTEMPQMPQMPMMQR